MTERPIDRLRGLYDRWAEGDFSTTRDLLAPGVEWHQTTSVAWFASREEALGAMDT